MRLKLDENLGRRTVELFEVADHQVTTVLDQGLAGTADDRLLQVCSNEQRALVSLDLDFAYPLRFDPPTASGSRPFEFHASPAQPTSTRQQACLSST